LKGATMAQHAQQLGVTPTHLARASRTATCVTTADQLTARLLHQTQTALIDTKQSTKDNTFCSATYRPNTDLNVPKRLKEIQSFRKTPMPCSKRLF
jgi:AraC-like DNA-binding protein